ncbi:2-hydroxy-3-oxopropionate reductase/glyoxylate/succinic semialdehyde reductase [Octadecabacter temperatus]|uniref:2-hydroxy-3-oxopropionate reductase n=1 Tax=Octadecabacter temperatus TaxID=1458307 RepID=A0A0K0Y896_9RHOB|nr:NAD(P)-dependent oxidoreductase [Octadecabacter temperatus]AKS47194.1 2-hydroxy-3-oxopropionate reductase [Octadecabacter temperatus]SIO45440.1 2-hydroxy-3-oxopropionate reductase/glyoxylate/succinic semialdehyde reductase [Octadecabacter temperatus]
MTDTLQTIGIFGLGLIGSAVARRLIGAGHIVHGFDPDPARSVALENLGGKPCSATQVWDADVIFSCVFDTDQLAAVIEMAPNAEKVLVSVSTCDPDQMRGLADAAAKRGVVLIEAPISGTSRALSNGDVLLLVAGDEGTVEQIAPILAAMSRQYMHVGAIGNGNRAKLAINLVLGLNRAALAEGLVYAEALGLAPNDFLDIAKASAAQSAVMNTKGQMMAQREFAAQGRIAQSAKDFTLIRDGAAAIGQGLPFTETYLAMMHDAIEKGEGDLDNSAVLLPIARTRPKGD